MSSDNFDKSPKLVYVKWPDKKELKCPICGSNIKYLYNDGGRKVITLNGIIKLYTCYYSCTNKECEYNRPHTVFQNIVLPYKHFGLDVWRWVIIDYVEFHDPYTTISKRIYSHFRIKISPNTVKSIIETFLAANSDQAIEETKTLVGKNGRIFLMLDGQRPNKKDHMLWIFIDTLTDRILHMEYLISADSKALSKIIKKIQDKYDVAIKAVISDHQSSIIKAVKETLPGIPHQFCHFHFLKNLSRNIGAFDSHLHVELGKYLNKLAYYKLNSPDLDIIINNTTYNIKNMVSMILEDISRLINRCSRDFDFFNGFELYNDLQNFIDKIKNIRSITSNNKTFYKILLRIEINIRNALKRSKNIYNIVKKLIPLFNEIRTILASQNENSEEVKKRADQWASNIKQIIKKDSSKLSLKNLKYKRTTYKSDLLSALIEWYRLYMSHKSGLFYYCDNKGLPRSIVELEQLFSLESRHFRMCSGNSQIGNSIRTKGGEYCQIINCYSQDKIITILLKLDKSYLKNSTKRFRGRQLKSISYRYYKKEKYPFTELLIKNLQSNG